MDMKTEIEREDSGIKESWVGDAMKLTDAEKNVSFLNNYFIFKKRENLTTKVEIKTSNKQEELITKEQEELFEKVEKTMKRPKTKVKKFKKKIKLPA